MNSAVLYQYQLRKNDLRSKTDFNIHQFSRSREVSANAGTSLIVYCRTGSVKMMDMRENSSVKSDTQMCIAEFKREVIRKEKHQSQKHSNQAVNLLSLSML